MISNEDTMKIGMCLNHIAMVLDDTNLDKIKPYLRGIEETVLKYRQKGDTNES